MSVPIHGRSVVDPLLARLRSTLGAHAVLVGEQTEPYGVDYRKKYRGRPIAVVRPQDTTEVAGICRACFEAGVPLIPQGGNTSLSGGSVPRRDDHCMILSMSRMNRLLSVDPANYTVTAEAGCILQVVHEAADAVHRKLSLEWGAIATATVGGAISTNAGGMNVLRYGNTREQVLGLEVVLADGTVWHGLRSLRKDASGYDLKQAFIGAEGTLGVVTKAVLRLHHKPAMSQSMFAALPRIDKLSRLFELAREHGGESLSAFELMSGPLLHRALSIQPGLAMPLAQRAPWYVLIRVAGSTPPQGIFEALYEAACKEDLLGEAVMGHTLEQEEALWALRHEMNPPRYLTGRMLKWDASVPLDAIPRFLAETAAAVAALDEAAQVIAFGHVGDGNLHLSVWPRMEVAPARLGEVCEGVVRAVDQIIWRYGGSICAEHGVGVEALPRLGGQKSEVELRLMRALKAMLDPRRILNPGALLP